MNHATEVMISFSTYDRNAADQEWEGAPRRDLAIERAWVPQTMGDQVWVFYRFRNSEDRQTFLDALTPAVKACVRLDWSRPWGMP